MSAIGGIGSRITTAFARGTVDDVARTVLAPEVRRTADRLVRASTTTFDLAPEGATQGAKALAPLADPVKRAAIYRAFMNAGMG